MDTGKQPNTTNRVQRFEKVMTVYSWLLEGHNKAGIVKKSREAGWLLKPCTLSTYIQDASEIMKEDLESYRTRAISDLMAKYMFIYQRAVEKDDTQGDWLAKGVLDTLLRVFKVEDKIDQEEGNISRTAILAGIDKLSDELGINLEFEGKGTRTHGDFGGKTGKRVNPETGQLEASDEN